MKRSYPFWILSPPPPMPPILKNYEKSPKISSAD